MSEITGLNGMPVASDKKRTITLEYDLRSTALKIGGELENMDLAINMLEQALRYLKNQQIAQTIIQLGQRLEQEQRILQKVMQ